MQQAGTAHADQVPGLVLERERAPAFVDEPRVDGGGAPAEG